MISEGDYSTFVSYDAHISNGPFALSEGYGPRNSEGIVTGETHNIFIKGTDTHFINNTTYYDIYDNNGQIVPGATGYADVRSQLIAYIKIRTVAPGVLTASGSPYTVVITTPNVYVEYDGTLQAEVLYASIFVGMPIYMAAGNNGNVYTSCDPGYWKGDATFTLNTDIYASAFFNETYFLVGAGGNVYYRNDNTTWTACSTPGVSETLRGIAYSNDTQTYVAVGDNGRIIYSTDGISWNMAASGTTNNLYGVAYGNGNFIAVGAQGVNIRSADGITWTTGQIINSGYDINDIKFKYNKFIAVGNPQQVTFTGGQYRYDHNLFHTTDGISWDVVFITYTVAGKNVNYSEIPAFKSITWDDSYFLIGTSKGNIYYSTGLKEEKWWLFTLTWSQTSTGVSTPLNDMDWKDGCFFAVTTSGRLLYSYAGISGWQILKPGSMDLNTVTTR